MLIGLVGEGKLLVCANTVMLGAMTLIGETAVVFGRSTEGLMTPMVVVETVGPEKMVWIPMVGVALKTGILAVEANDIPGKATLNLGRGSPAGGGVRLSGEALGGVIGVYGDVDGMFTMVETGVACCWDTLICALAATAALMASSLWARKFSRWLSRRTC